MYVDVCILSTYTYIASYILCTYVPSSVQKLLAKLYACRIVASKYL